jgi:hypothetical protein
MIGWIGICVWALMVPLGIAIAGFAIRDAGAWWSVPALAAACVGAFRRHARL